MAESIIPVDPNPARVAFRHLLASRPIYIDKQALQHFVQTDLIPSISKWLKRQPQQNDPIGSVDHIAQATLQVEKADQRSSDQVRVQIHARSSRSKGVAVLSGSAGRAAREINVWINGALSPEDFLVPTKWSDRMSPVWECSSPGCLPYGIYAVLLHEVTHMAEVAPPSLSYNPRDVIEKGEAVWEGYINDPGEVRAFMQEVVDAAERLAPKLRVHMRSNQQLMETVLTLTTTWSIIEKHLKPRERVKILKAVYEVLDRKGLLLE